MMGSASLYFLIWINESFHIAMSVCQFCNMSLGFKVGEDEHAAYIAGFAGDCVSEFINSKNTD